MINPDSNSQRYRLSPFTVRQRSIFMSTPLSFRRSSLTSSTNHGSAHQSVPSWWNIIAFLLGRNCLWKCCIVFFVLVHANSALAKIHWTVAGVESLENVASATWRRHVENMTRTMKIHLQSWRWLKHNKKLSKWCAASRYYGFLAVSIKGRGMAREYHRLLHERTSYTSCIKTELVCYGFPVAVWMTPLYDCQPL